MAGFCCLVVLRRNWFQFCLTHIFGTAWFFLSVVLLPIVSSVHFVCIQIFAFLFVYLWRTSVAQTWFFSSVVLLPICVKFTLCASDLCKVFILCFQSVSSVLPDANLWHNQVFLECGFAFNLCQMSTLCTPSLIVCSPWPWLQMRKRKKSRKNDFEFFPWFRLVKSSGNYLQQILSVC